MIRNKAVGERGTSEDPVYSEDKEGWSHHGIEW